ncbi:hypothetical protein DFQ26_004346 [Actinomortierella ambigua]|nr:hypothetical protein DFQ26_004346 [Actinomortierella ambigua]
MAMDALRQPQSSYWASKQFYRIAMDDQVWRSLALKSSLPENCLEKARLICGGGASWHSVMRTATIIMRENERIMQNTLLQMRAKIEQVRRSLDRQTRVLDETHRRLASLASKLRHMECCDRQRERARVREQVHRERMAEDQQWFSEWAASDEVRELQLEQMDLDEVEGFDI